MSRICTQFEQVRSRTKWLIQDVRSASGLFKMYIVHAHWTSSVLSCKWDTTTMKKLTLRKRQIHTKTTRTNITAFKGYIKTCYMYTCYHNYYDNTCNNKHCEAKVRIYWLQLTLTSTNQELRKLFNRWITLSVNDHHMIALNVFTFIKYCGRWCLLQSSQKDDACLC